MKTRIFRVKVLAVVLFCMFGCTASVMASDLSKYYHNDEVVDGKLSTRYIYTESNLLLTPKFRYEYSYNADGKTDAMRVSEWDSYKKVWKLSKKFLYSYNGDTVTIELQKCMSNGKSCPVSKYAYTPESDGTTLQNSEMYCWNESRKAWELSDDCSGIDSCLLASRIAN